MLTRLKVSGFKNLVDVDVRFGAFTCIAGANGVGKSNLFDAIRFLSALADKTLIEAALSVRDDSGRAADIRSIFHHSGGYYTDEISFEAEMIIPRSGVDDLGQTAEATITFLRYEITLAYRQGENGHPLGKLEITHEALKHINVSGAAKDLAFPHKPDWRNSVITGNRKGSPFISTIQSASGITQIQLHQDGSQGRPGKRNAASLPRSVLSATNAAESPTALLARREMQSWRLLQLEPASLRRPDEYTAPTQLGADGSHLAATLNRLAHTAPDHAQIYGQIANRLSELVEDIRAIEVDRDDQRRLLTVQVSGNDGTRHSAQALSDGTLRFLALAVLEQDPEAQGVICLEEPENGIHPARIPKILKLLQEIAVDVTLPIGEDNPLRQVIVNTHSPLVVQEVPDDSLLYADLVETIRNAVRFKRAAFSYLPDTWREKAVGEEGQEPSIVAKGKLLAYLGALGNHVEASPSGKPRKVKQRHDLQPVLFGDNV